MKRPVLFLSFIAAFLFVLGSCGFGKIADSAKPAAEKFYEHMKAHEYEAMEKMLYSGADVEEWMNVIRQKEVLGEMTSFKKNIGFSSSINNGVTTVELNYTCKYDEGTTAEKITLIQEGEAFKVYGYEYKQK